MAKKIKKPTRLENRKARFNYTFLDNFEAGIVLTGDEIKAVRAGKVNLTSSHVKIIGGEVFWLGGVISILGGDQQRSRKLLLHKNEIEKLFAKSEEKGLTIIPTKIYFKKNRAKLQIALSRGKKKYDKRELIKERDLDRESARRIK